jgi:hypothetical protein
MCRAGAVRSCSEGTAANQNANASLNLTPPLSATHVPRDRGRARFVPIYIQTCSWREQLCTACFYSPAYIKGFFANGLRVCRICIEPLRVMRPCTHTIYIYVYIYIYIYIYAVEYVWSSRLRWVRYLKCSICVMTHELRFWRCSLKMFSECRSAGWCPSHHSPWVVAMPSNGPTTSLRYGYGDMAELKWVKSHIKIWHTLLIFQIY